MYRESQYIFGLKNGMTKSRSDYFWACDAVERILSKFLTHGETQERKVRLDYLSAINQVVDEMMGKSN